MITQFKIFEHVYKLPKIGDYAILDSEQFKTNYLGTEELINFLDSTVGIVTHQNNDTFEIKFENIYNLTVKKYLSRPNNSLFVQIIKIKYWSENKEELEILLQTKKYNL